MSIAIGEVAFMNALSKLSEELLFTQLKLLKIPDPLELVCHECTPHEYSSLLDSTVHHSIHSPWARRNSTSVWLWTIHFNSSLNGLSMPWVARKVITDGTRLGLQMLSLLWFLFIFSILLEMDSLRWIYLAATSGTVDTACAIRRDWCVAREPVSVHHVCSKGLHVVSVVELSLVVTVIYLDRLSIIQIILQSNQRSLTFFQENSKRRKKIKRF